MLLYLPLEGIGYVHTALNGVCVRVYLCMLRSPAHPALGCGCLQPLPHTFHWFLKRPVYV